MAENKKHLYLVNPKQQTTGFKKTRGRDKEEKKVEAPKYPNPKHQKKLREAYNKFILDQQYRHENRKIQVPAHIDLITIYFFKTFDLSLRKIFFQKCGLNAVDLKDFNRTVLFTIANEESVKTFKKHLESF